MDQIKNKVVISGKVVTTGIEIPDKNIRVLIYKIVRKESKETFAEIYRQKKYSEISIDINGEFEFEAEKGLYSIKIDENTVSSNCISHPVHVNAFKSKYIRIYVDSCGKAEKKRKGPENETDVYEIIESMYEHRQISIHQKNKLLTYYLFDRDKLPDKFKNRQNRNIKCASPVIQELIEYVVTYGPNNRYSSEVLHYLRKMLPELEKTFFKENGIFRIHYSEKGKHAAAGGSSIKKVNDYIRELYASLEYTMEQTCNQRGFRKPVIPYGSKYIDVYVYDLNGIYGYTAPVKFQRRNRFNSVTGAVYLAFDNTYEEAKGFKGPVYNNMHVSAAHEFFHAVQFAYNINADRWWKEATATWNEDEIYPEVNDYIKYVKDIFENPEKPLDAFTYSGVVYAKYLSEYKGGHNIIKNIWEAHERYENSSLKAIDHALKSTGNNSSLGASYNEFSAFNFNPSQYYNDGRMWDVKASPANTYENYPAAYGGGRLKHLSSDYQLFYMPAKQQPGSLVISVETASEIMWGFKLQCKRISDNSCDTLYVDLSDDYDKTDIVLDNASGKYSEVCFIPSNLDNKKDDAQYSYTVSFRFDEY